PTRRSCIRLCSRPLCNLLRYVALSAKRRHAAVDAATSRRPRLERGVATPYNRALSGATLRHRSHRRQPGRRAAAVRAVRDVKDLPPEIVLPQDIVFLDRKGLRGELEKLSKPGPCGGLLVRGPSGTGKSWTQQFINCIAVDPGARASSI